MAGIGGDRCAVYPKAVEVFAMAARKMLSAGERTFAERGWREAQSQMETENSCQKTKSKLKSKP